MTTTQALILLYFCFLLATLRWGQRFVQGPWFFLLRAFFPNWKFFHAVGHEPRLFVRAGPAGANAQQWDAVPWQLLYPRRQRRAWQLLHNADVNLALSQQNLVDHFAHDVHQLPPGADVRNLVSYQLISAYARHGLGEAVGSGSAYQFQLRMVLSGADGPLDSHTVLTAPPQTVQA